MVNVELGHTVVSNCIQFVMIVGQINYLESPDGSQTHDLPHTGGSFRISNDHPHHVYVRFPPPSPPPPFGVIIINFTVYKEK